MQYLETAVKEMKQCSAALSKGDLSSFKPARENFLCENLKNIHANLNHLTWQAKQVAKGDYSQTVSYLGEFSEAFNTMTEQLREREKISETYRRAGKETCGDGRELQSASDGTDRKKRRRNPGDQSGRTEPSVQ